jgi:hypothetical protein
MGEEMGMARHRFGVLVAALVVAIAGEALIGAPASAAPPATGTVIEGHSVPGVALGDTRRQVEQAWGEATFCQSGSKSGDRALCTWQRPDGSVDLSFRGHGGGNPSGGPKDVVAGADWTGLPGWRTTAGITAPDALADPESVPPAYPAAVVYRYGDGHVREVIDAALGIEVVWTPILYTPDFTVTIEIFQPRT